MSRARTFLVLWILAIVATCAAFVFYLALRVRSIELGYELGRAHGRVARLREVKRVLELELASHKTPERVDLVARTLLGMSEPTAERILAAGKPPEPEPAVDPGGLPGGGGPVEETKPEAADTKPPSDDDLQAEGEAE
jgi:cell division protein FtsL